ncbi:MAG: helix-turn-helix domain-containing protein [Oscillospiraceae bacterium]|nr:helix-turn-helix domain-containing protein [Oscillospiraceae bacterium]
MKTYNVYKNVLKNYPDVLTVDEVSNALKVSTKTVYRLLKENKIDHICTGRIYRIPKANLLAYLKLNIKSS